MKNLFLDIFQRLVITISYLIKKGFSEKKFLEQILDEDSIVLDIGSNLGNFTSQVLNVNKKITVHSVEPLEELVNYQKKRFKNSKNIKIYNFAIDISNGFSTLYIREPNSHSSLDINHQDEKINKIKNEINIKTISMNSFLTENNISKVNLLKLDTEGNDLKILTSLKEHLITGKIQYIKIEVHIRYFKEMLIFAQENHLHILGFNNLFYLNNRIQMFDLFLENKN